ncbi:hypothetical protein [Lysobacter auxotrophicus]|uniref:Tetratricopeptide repeat protein n=1 Tax=Lysobacter auxotrophicus TaxID=2992573 RepID=A0ABM8DEE4_9GAMM|nr:hypothetical protein [Lysobacter auxotrophicus]BDU16973.1 tetratricopeptide repeat protein [Lysobacter auxotrophicus]
MLGQVAANDGAGERAIELYRVAVRRDPRDWQAHAFLMDTAFRRGARGEGVRHLDAILRVNPDLAKPLLEQLVTDFGDARLRQAAIDAVVGEPPWAGQMWAALRGPKADAGITARFIQELSARRPLTTAERSTLIDALLRAGSATDARAVWVASLASPLRRLAGTVYDGDFEEMEPVTGAFAWTWDAGPGVDVTLETGAAASGRQFLRIAFSGRATTLRAPSQRLALVPGAYTLSAAFDDQTDASRPFELELSCTTGGGLTRMELSGASETWQRVSTSFDVPANCTQQALRLTQRSRSIADTLVSGLLRLDDVQIRKTLQ